MPLASYDMPRRACVWHAPASHREAETAAHGALLLGLQEWKLWNVGACMEDWLAVSESRWLLVTV